MRWRYAILTCDRLTTSPAVANFSDGPWTLVRYFTDRILPEGFDLDRVLSDSGIMINTVPHIVRFKHAESFGLVGASPCISLLSEKVSGQTLTVLGFLGPNKVYCARGAIPRNPFRL